MAVSLFTQDKQQNTVLNTWRSQEVRKALATAAALVGSFIVQQYYATNYNKERKNDLKLSGQEWVDELLAGHRTQFYEQMGMNKHVFCPSPSFVFIDLPLWALAVSSMNGFSLLALKSSAIVCRDNEKRIDWVKTVRISR
jgi:hypothetical protein